jgi:hypothetical protein
MEKRTWCYLQQPFNFEMAACDCGNEETQWSEYKDHLWCDKCQKDFIPKHTGIFSGPIPIMASRMLGLHFDRFNILTEQAEILDEANLPDNLHYVPCINPYVLFKNKHIDVEVKYFVDNKFTLQKAFLSYKDGEVKIELNEPLKEQKAKGFHLTINFNYPETESFYLTLFINDDLKNFSVGADSNHIELLKFINKNELKYILTEANS